MQNFITNAFHYTNQGEIEVKLYQKNHSVVFSVRDTGMGLTYRPWLESKDENQGSTFYFSLPILKSGK